MHWIVTAQAAIGAVLLFAAVAKLARRTSVRPFLDTLGWPPSISILTARALPVLELVCGALLILDLQRTPALLTTGAMTTGFAMTLLVAHRRGVTEGCRCFGALDTGSMTPVAVARALTLALAAAGLVAYHLGTGAPYISSNRPTAIDTASGVLIAAVTVTSFALLERIYVFEDGRKRVLARARSTLPTVTEGVGP